MAGSLNYGSCHLLIQLQTNEERNSVTLVDFDQRHLLDPASDSSHKSIRMVIMNQVSSTKTSAMVRNTPLKVPQNEQQISETDSQSSRYHDSCSHSMDDTSESSIQSCFTRSPGVKKSVRFDLASNSIRQVPSRHLSASQCFMMEQRYPPSRNVLSDVEEKKPSSVSKKFKGFVRRLIASKRTGAE